MAQTSFTQRLYRLVNPRLRFRLVNFLHRFDRFRQSHYSQNGEDILLVSMFPKGYEGFYVDVGAHHPYRLSNTYLLFKQGWHGVNIDANPDTIEMFAKARPKDTNLNLGVGTEAGLLPFHRFADPAVNTFSNTEAERWKQKTWNTYLGTTKVSVEPLQSILKRYLLSGTAIDVLNVDVEGLDLNALQSNDWQQFRPKVVVVEDHKFTLERPNDSEIYRFLSKENYQLVHKVKFSLLFEDKQQATQTARAAAPKQI